MSRPVETGWSAMIVTPERMIGIISSMLKKCCQPTQVGKPAFSSAPLGTTVPGYVSVNWATVGISRRPLATAMKTMSKTKPIGSSQRRLNHLLRPIRTRGATPYCAGTEPAQEPSTASYFRWSSSCLNPARAFGVMVDAAGGGNSSGVGLPLFAMLLLLLS